MNVKKNNPNKSILTILFLFELLTLPNLTLAIDIPAQNWVSILDKSDPLINEIQTIPADAHVKGMWSSVGSWPIVSVHALLSPNGKVLSYGTDRTGGFDGRYFDEWDPSKGLASDSHLTRFQHSFQNSFCSTATFLPQGDVLIAGGDSPRTSMIYTPDAISDQDALKKTASNLGYDRWYPTMITLPNGNPIMLGGMMPYKESMGTEVQNALNSGWASMTPEIYDTQTQTWRSLFGATSRAAFGPDLNRTSYPRAWVAPNGDVFGVSADKMWWLDPSGDGSVTEEAVAFGALAASDPENVGSTNTAAMFDIGKILIVGGNGRGWFDGLPASKKTTVIDINSGSAVLDKSVGDMTHPRRMAMATVLASGEVVVLGGTSRGYEVNNGVYAAEIWNPETGQWKLGSDASVFKSYHSNATLLANGTILYHGGGFPVASDGLKSQIYYPPYLFQNNNGATQLATRPKIKAISGLNYVENSPIQLDIEGNDTISQLVLVGLSNGTHAFNPGQRRIPLQFSQDTFRLSASLPNYHLTPPGYYQVVAINQEGVPSKGVIIGIGNDVKTPGIPTEAYTPPQIGTIDLPPISINGVANYQVSQVPGVTYSWNFGDGSPQTDFFEVGDITHTFTSSGVYQVRLTINDQGQTTSKTFLQAVKPNTQPTANTPSASTSILYDASTSSTHRVWVVNPDNDKVSIIDTASGSLERSITVGESPRSIALSPSGKVWVTNKKSATISVINPSTMTVEKTIAIARGSQPHGLAFAPNKNHAYIALEATGQLLKVDAVSGNTIASINLGINIRQLSVNHDSSRVYVSRFITKPLPGESTLNVDTSSAGGEVMVVNATDMTLLDTVILKHSDKPDTQIQGSGIPNYLGAPVISPDNTSAWVPSKQDNIKRGSLRNGVPLDFQNTVRAISSNINLSTLTEDYSKRVDHDNSSLGTAAVYHPDGVYLFVALETSREVAVVDAIKGFELFKFDVNFAPQGLAISQDGKTLYVQNFMDRSVSVIDLSPLVDQGVARVNNSSKIYTIALNDEKLAPEVLLGKQLFYDAKDPKLSKDSYMSCATCHNDGGSDGRVWDLSSLGEGLRNTIELNGRSGLGHGFLHWSANFDEVQDFEGQIRGLAGGTGLMSDALFNAGTRNQPLGDKKAGLSQDLDFLAAYVESLDQFPETPYGNGDKTLTDQANIGRTLFHTHDCISCHSTTKFTNSLNETTLRDIGTLKSTSGKRLNGQLTGLDVPTLRDVWKTAPYLHDGSAVQISDAIQAHANLSMTEGDASNIAQYVLELNNDVLLNNQAPTVKIDSPLNNQSFDTNVLNFQVSATDDVEIKKVDLYEGDVLLATDTIAPYRFEVVVNQMGEHTYYAKATDNDGVASNSDPITIITNGIPDTPPSTATFCSTEWATCTLPAGKTAIIWFGAVGGNYLHKTLTGSFGCNIHTFEGNPNVGIAEDCRYVLVEDNTPPPSPNVLPTVSLSSGNTTVVQGGQLSITATANDSDGTIARVEFYQGTTLVSTDTTAPYTYDLVTTQAGSYSFTAKAVDDAGGEATSNALTIVITAPVGAIPDTPPSTATFCSTEWATCTLPAGKTAIVWFGTVGGNYLHKTLTGSFGCNIHTFEGNPNVGIAEDCRYVLVEDNTPPPSPNVLPTVSLSSGNTTVVQGGQLSITATANDSDGTIARVEFYQGTTLVSTDTTAPYTYDLVTTQAGSYSFTAKAVDDAGGEATSNALTIVITAPVGAIPDTPPSTATFCSTEWATCTLPAGKTAIVWFGTVGGNYLHKTLTGSFGCNIHTFEGNPNVGIAEDCRYVITEQ